MCPALNHEVQSTDAKRIGKKRGADTWTRTEDLLIMSLFWISEHPLPIVVQALTATSPGVGHAEIPRPPAKAPFDGAMEDAHNRQPLTVAQRCRLGAQRLDVLAHDRLGAC